ncbi:hypothetical protein VDGL01_07129 [Verticillium dahliae]
MSKRSEGGGGCDGDGHGDEDEADAMSYELLCLPGSDHALILPLLAGRCCQQTEGLVDGATVSDVSVSTVHVSVSSVTGRLAGRWQAPAPPPVSSKDLWYVGATQHQAQQQDAAPVSRCKCTGSHGACPMGMGRLDAINWTVAFNWNANDHLSSIGVCIKAVWSLQHGRLYLWQAPKQSTP